MVLSWWNKAIGPYKRPGAVQAHYPRTAVRKQRVQANYIRARQRFMFLVHK